MHSVFTQSIVAVSKRVQHRGLAFLVCFRDAVESTRTQTSTTAHGPTHHSLSQNPYPNRWNCWRPRGCGQHPQHNWNHRKEWWWVSTTLTIPPLQGLSKCICPQSVEDIAQTFKICRVPEDRISTKPWTFLSPWSLPNSWTLWVCSHPIHVALTMSPLSDWRDYVWLIPRHLVRIWFGCINSHNWQLSRSANQTPWMMMFILRSFRALGIIFKRFLSSIVLELLRNPFSIFLLHWRYSRTLFYFAISQPLTIVLWWIILRCSKLMAMNQYVPHICISSIQVVSCNR